MDFKRIPASLTLMMGAAVLLWHGMPAGAATPEDVVRIDFRHFPDGSPIPDETVIRDQFASLGVRFEEVYADGPMVLKLFNGTLVSGGQTRYVGDIRIVFTEWCKPRVVKIDLIGGGIPIGATVDGYSPEDLPLGTVTYMYTLSPATLAPMAFIAPRGDRIRMLVFNGGLSADAAAMIGTLRFSCE